MATTYQSAPVSQGRGRRGINVDVRTYTYPAPVLVVDDVIEMIPVFEGETVLNVELSCEDLDDGAGIVLAVGDGTTADRYITGSTIGQAGGLEKHSQGTPFAYTADDTIDVKCTTAPTTGTTGNITVTVFVI